MKILVKVDAKTGEIKTGYKRDFFRSDVLFIEIGDNFGSNGYLATYLQFILESKRKEKIDSTTFFDRNNNEAKAMATALADFLGKEFKTTK